MTTQNISQATTETTELAPLTPEEIVEQIRALRQRIPQYVHLPIPDAKAIGRAANVSVPFRNVAINTIGASAEVEHAVGYTSASLRQDADEVTRMTAVEDELRVTLKGVTASNLVRRHRIGLAALQTYSITRQLVRKKENAHLLPFVAEMTRLNKFGRRRAATPEVPQQPPGTPTVNPPVKPDTVKPTQ